jgi:hypothetical protein
VFDILQQVFRRETLRGALRKSMNGLMGGAVGGCLGGLLYLLLRALWTMVFSSKPVDKLWSPSATGFVILGMSIGLMIALAQVILKEAWVKVEQGFRAGRQIILSKPELTIGRAEACDLGLFGDAGIEKVHARIVLTDGRYALMDAGTPGGTFLNGQRLSGPTPLSSGDLIGVGHSLIRFQEKRKQMA